MNMLDKDSSVLVVIDVQERLVAMLEKDEVVKKTAILCEAAKILGVPVIVTEQYPKGLGETVQKVKDALPEDAQFTEKTAFSAFQEPAFAEKLKNLHKKQVVICGIEAHVCVHQSASDLVAQGYDVYVAKDASASREKYEFKQGIERMKDNGTKISCVEIILFEWLKTSKNEHFKQVQALIK